MIIAHLTRQSYQQSFCHCSYSLRLADINCSWVLYQAAEWGYATLHAWNETVFTADLYGDDDDGLRYTVTINRAWPRAY